MDHSEIIDALDGTTKVAALCEVSPQAVSQWRNKGIPKQQLRYLKLARPDVFGDEPKPTKKRRVPPP